jgi:hypothetical protein
VVEDAVATATTSINVRPLAVPNEHGGWGILLEPLLIGLLVAPSAGGAAIAVAMIATFFVRHPLKFAARDWLQRKRYPRTRVCEKFVAAYGAIAIGALLFAAWMSDPRSLLPLLLALPLAALQFAYDARNRGRELTPELCGAIGAGAGGAACVLAGGGTIAVAGLIWLLAAFRAAPAVLHVRALLRRRKFSASIITHVLALAIVIALRLTAPIVAIFTLLLLRAATGPLRASNSRPSVIGIEEVMWGIATVIAIVVGIRI